MGRFDPPSVRGGALAPPVPFGYSEYGGSFSLLKNSIYITEETGGKNPVRVVGVGWGVDWMGEGPRPWVDRQRTDRQNGMYRRHVTLRLRTCTTTR